MICNQRFLLFRAASIHVPKCQTPQNSSYGTGSNSDPPGETGGHMDMCDDQLYSVLQII